MLKTARLDFLRTGLMTLAFLAAAWPALSQDGGASAAAPGSDKSLAIKEEIGKELVAREEGEMLADGLARDAATAYQNGEYKKAVDLYLQAVENLKKCSATSEYVQNKLESCKASISKAYYHWSQQLARDAEQASNAGDMDTAIRRCTEAIKMYPPCKEKMEEAISRYSNLKKAVEYRGEVAEKTIDPKKESRLYNVDVLLKQGEILYKDGQLDQAREKYEEVLSINPYNEQAIDAIRKINLRLLDKGVRRTQLTRTERITEVEWKNVTPLIPRVSSAGESESISAPIKKDDEDNGIYRKLRDIIIDHIEFEEVTIPTVVKYLKERSKAKDIEKVGVNIFLRLDSGAMPAAAAPAEGAPAEGAAPAAPANVPTVTMVVDDIPLGEAIRYICRAANLKYRVEKYAVVIASQDVPLDEVETRIYPIEKDSGIAGVASDPESVRKQFEDRGIKFPAGAKIVYDERISRLIVTNTPDNLGKIEEIIKEMNVVDPQVLIQAKFVEITQNDLEELGFEYLVSRQNTNITGLRASELQAIEPGVTYTVPHDMLGWAVDGAANPQGLAEGTYTSGAPTVYTAGTQVGGGANYYYLTDAIGKSDTTFGQNGNLVRNVKDNFGDYGLTATRPDEIMNWAHYNRYGYRVNATVHALDQADSSDVLSTPRVTTMNGQEAVIRMVTQKYYPESWGEATIAEAGTSSIFTASTPEFGDPTDEGIILRVTPNVDADHYTITLQMNPVVQQFIGWTDYSYDVANGASTYTNTLKMPIIEARTVETTVSCYDGETVVLGGIIKDTTTTVNDAYPVLGDLPLVGRLFQSKGKYSTKTNLLIFLTCRLVNPDGSPIREREMRGLPPFRQ